MEEARTIDEQLEALPRENLTTHVLESLRGLWGGEWENLTSLEAMARSVTGEHDEGALSQVCERARALYVDEGEGYQAATELFFKVDGADRGVEVPLARRAGAEGRYAFLASLAGVTAPPAPVQAWRAAVKLAAERAACALLKGVPRDAQADFSPSLRHYTREASLRVRAFLALDCMLPLGNDFVPLLRAAAAAPPRGADPLLSRVGPFLPGKTWEQKRAHVARNVEQCAPLIERLLRAEPLSREAVLDEVCRRVSFADRSPGYVAAMLLRATSSFAHLGPQSVCRTLVTRAQAELEV
jgi:hypothetical protein